MEPGVLELLGKEHPIRILLLLRQEGPQRFSQIEHHTHLNPAQVDRSLKHLRQGLWVKTETLPEENGPVHVQYEITERGEALLEAVDALRETLDHQRSILGDDPIDDVDALYP